MCLVLNLAKMAKVGISNAAMEETHNQIRNQSVDVGDVKKQLFEFPGHHNVKAAMVIHPAMLCVNYMATAFLATMAQH